MNGKRYSLQVCEGHDVSGVDPVMVDQSTVPDEVSGFTIFMLMLGEGSYLLASW